VLTTAATGPPLLGRAAGNAGRHLDGAPHTRNGEARSAAKMKTKHESRRDTVIQERNKKKKKQIIFMAALKINS
jgi:hypothetical protein